MDLTDICEQKQCSRLIYWEQDYGESYPSCGYSCTKIGQSIIVDKYPEDCFHKCAMKEYIILQELMK